KSNKSFDKLKAIWQDRDVLIVEGKLTRSGEGNDLFAGARSIKRIVCPAKNAYSKLEQIESAIRENADNRLVLVMLGPTAKVVVDDLRDMDNQIIDLGHIDSEYEWYKMKTLYAVALPNKHSAEFDLGVTLKKDTTFDNEVVAEIK
ncbi:GT-D fold domain-containing glycosyltransferase, partial [uncultured Lactobacillus sp.]|uniref:GT-D fold domain-containing glycosyltransferase n=1 Tax=uncultured Lactobacillus sp. TaxID=153152 RepID=UPI00262A429D